MKVMYIKYEKGKKHTTIKEGENIIMNTENIINLPIKQISTESSLTYNSTSINVIPLSNSTSDISHDIDEKITNFFFDAIHKNYIRKQKYPIK